VIDTLIEAKDLEDPSEYAFGFWMKFLTRYPTPMLKGKSEPWYFVARLTSNRNYADNNEGDRLLTLF
jgi:hypothetical protein